MNTITKTQRALSYALKTVVILSAVIGTLISYLAGRNSFMGGRHVFMYFTIQSNILMAIICGYGLYLLLKEKEITRGWYTFKFVGTVSITLTGFVFAFMLAPILGDNAWNLQNTLTHLIVPLASVIDFFVMSDAAKIKKTSVFYVTIPPILYVIYAGIGFVNNWQFAEGVNYPYFFLNWGSKAGAFGFTDELPFMGSVWWILVLLIFLMIVGYAYLAVADLISKGRGHRDGVYSHSTVL
jgi:hypothetical protein